MHHSPACETFSEKRLVGKARSLHSTPPRRGEMQAARTSQQITFVRRHDLSPPVCPLAPASYLSRREPHGHCFLVFRAAEDGRHRLPNRLRGRGRAEEHTSELQSPI